MNTQFSWKALQAQLAQSEFLRPGDDLGSQRGLIATSAAILERMAIANARATHGTWTPERVLYAKMPRQPRSEPAQAVCGAGPTGGALIVKKPPAPSQPRPGGFAVAIPDREPVGIGAPPARRPAQPVVTGGADDWF